jgi:tetratricopeptide (TPR) repeat protein
MSPKPSSDEYATWLLPPSTFPIEVRHYGRTSVVGLARLVLSLIAASLFLNPISYVRASSPLARADFLLTTQSKKDSTKESVQQDAATVGLGFSVERELKGGETNSFRIPMTSGQFLYVIVDQRGIDVAVTLVGPDGKPLAKADSPNSNHGPEPLVSIAEVSGDYRIEVSAPSKNAPIGRYEISIVALRETTATDREHVAAEKAFWEGEKLRSQRTAISNLSAIEAYKQALPFLESSGDSYRHALTLQMIGARYAELGEFQRALEYYEQALPLFRVTTDKYQQSNTLNSIGGAYDVLGNLPKALEYYRQALLLLPSGNEPRIEGAILSNIGKIFSDIAEWQEALEYYYQALSRFRSVGEKRREAITLSNIGAVYTSLGEKEKSLDYLQQALSIQRNIGDKVKEAETLTIIGQAYAFSGEPQKALEYYLQALPLRKAAGDRLGEARTLDYLGITHSSLGDQASALNYHQQALELRRAVGDLRGEALTLSNLGYLYTRSGQSQKATEYYNRALSVFRRIGDRQNEARALYGLARTKRSQENLVEARGHIEAALSLFEDVRAKAGSEQLRASYLASKQDAYQFCIEVLMEMQRLEPTKGHDAEALQASERGRARSLTEMLNEAHVDIRQGVGLDLIAKERELNQLLNAKAQRQIQLKAQKGNQQQVATLDKEISALEDEYQQVQVAIRKASPAYAALTQPQPLGLKEIQTQLDGSTMLLEYSLGEERSYVWAVTRNSLKTYELPKREQIEKAARRVYDLLTARSQTKAAENAQTKQARIAEADSQLMNASKELSRMVLGPIGSELAAERLVIVADGALQYIPFAMLPLPETRRPGDTDTRRIDPDRRVAASPNLRVGPVSLIEQHEIVSLPSVSALAIQREGLRNRKPAPNGLAVIADPVFSAADERLSARAKTDAAKQVQGDDSANTRIIEHLADDSGLIIRRLKFTRQEADQILAEAPRAKSFRAIDFKANRATATGGELSKYRFVHFATHGYIDSERPDLSAIVLSLVDEQGKSQDGFLRANEIYNLNLPAELVVLSACETGLGKEIKGEGLVGLTRGFMYAGARRVVVSLWNVNDKATAELMARFYRGMLRENKTPAAALRTAQMEMSRQKQWQSPYYWAAFVLQGEWK